MRGFTLIEMIIVIVVVSILAAIALPAYREQILKGQRSDAKSALLEMASRQARFYSANVTYTEDIVSEQGLSWGKSTSEDDLYQLSITTQPSGCHASSEQCTYFKVTATALAEDARCESLSYDSKGVKSHTGTAESFEYCW